MSDGSTSTEFVDQARGWLADHAPAYELPGLAALTPFAAIDEETEVQRVAAARAWQRHKFDAGWAGLGTPAALGGRGLGRVSEALFAVAEADYHLPTHVLDVTLSMVLPTLEVWAPDRVELIGAMLRGEEIWCQLFSEPGAGSDLASIRTRAEREDDGSWRVSGQKVWTSWAFVARRGYLLARTASGPRHHDLTAFVVDMEAPGVSVRRLRQITGSATFSEVFLDDVRLPPDAVIGEVGGGWQVAITTLMNERLALGPEQIPLAELGAEAARRGLTESPEVRERLGHVAVQRHLLQHLRADLIEALGAGQPPGPAGSVGKLLLGSAARHAAMAARSIVGPDLLGGGPWDEMVLGALGFRIAGGTDEIVKDIIADRVLRLPRFVERARVS